MKRNAFRILSATALVVIAGCAAPRPPLLQPVVATCPDIPNPVLFGPVAGLAGKGPSREATHHLEASGGWPYEQTTSETSSSSFDRTQGDYKITTTSTTTESGVVIRGTAGFESGVLSALTPKQAWEENYRPTDVVVIPYLELSTATVSSSSSSFDGRSSRESEWKRMTVGPNNKAFYYHLVRSPGAASAGTP